MKQCCKYIKNFKEIGIWNEETTSFAAWNGHLDCLKYAHKNGCPLYKSLITLLIPYGHLDCIKYARENGCSWGTRTTSIASEYGHIDSLKYAIENGCPFNQQIMLSNLDKHASKIDLDDNWWRTFLFDKDLTTHSSLETLVNSKKEEIKQLQLSSEILISYVSKDVIKYVLWPYF